MTNLILLKNVVILPELFLGLSIVYLLLYGSIISTYKTYPLIQKLILNISVLILFFCIYLFYNDRFFFTYKSLVFFNDTIICDYLSFFFKESYCSIFIGMYLNDTILFKRSKNKSI
jgi:hypothetical protein